MLAAFGDIGEICMDKRIAVLDTGCHPEYEGKNTISGYSLTIRNGCVKRLSSYDDQVGHGTAVTCIIDHLVNNSHIVVIKIDEPYCKKHGIFKWLLAALDYICENEKFDVINISVGYSENDPQNSLEKICNRINEKGTIIVSAYDNNGVISYPAAFQSVIGVDSSPLLGTGKYVYVDEIVNIVAGIKKWSFPGCCNKYSRVSGNSFLAAEFSARIYNWLFQDIEPAMIRNVLKNSAQRIFNETEKSVHNGERKIQIKKAITYPYNKEISVLLRFQDQLNFDIYGYYDHPLLGKVGAELERLRQDVNSHKIQSIKELNWNDEFDTVILSHVDMLSQILQINVAEQIVESCLRYKKNLFLFDEDICFEKYSYAELVELFEQNGLWIHRPQKRTALDLQWGGKLYDIHCPVLCIAGTDSRQGKFTLQVTLRKFLKKRNIKVSNFGTEPSSELFGFEGVYTFGYNAYMPYEGWKNILAVNHALHQLETESPDIIITGLQSRTIVPDIAAFKSYPIKQQEFISGCSPDTYILCINMDDSLIYIRRTIKYLESVFPSKVIALCMNDIMYSKGRLSLLIIQCMYMLKFGKKVFRLSSGKSLDRLSKHIIHYYK